MRNSLRERVLRALSEHPDGLTIKQLYGVCYAGRSQPKYGENAIKTVIMWLRDDGVYIPSAFVTRYAHRYWLGSAPHRAPARPAVARGA